MTPQAITESKKALGDALAALRNASPDPASYRTMEHAARERMGNYAPASETIRAYHAGEVRPDRADLVLCCFLADYYGVRLSALHPVLAQRLNDARDLLTRTPSCFAATAA